MYMPRHPFCSSVPVDLPAPTPLTATQYDRQVIRAWRALTAGVVANIFRVRLVEIRSPSRRRARVAHARQTAIYLAHVSCGETMDRVAAMFARHRTTVRHACAKIEDCRDDRAFDRSLDLLEGALTGYLQVFMPHLAAGHRHEG